MKQLRCIWCCRDTKTRPCEHCKSDQVYEKTTRHRPHWSRATINNVECLICGRIGSYDEQGKPDNDCNK